MFWPDNDGPRLWLFAGSRDPSAIVMGDDVRLRPIGQLRRLRGPRQHLLHLQPKDARGQRASQQGTARSHRLPLLLSLPRRQPDSDQFGGHELRPVGHRDRSAGDVVPRPHRRRDVAVAVTRHAHLRLGGVRRLGQALGHQRESMQADVPRPRVGH